MGDAEGAAQQPPADDEQQPAEAETLSEPEEQHQPAPSDHDETGVDDVEDQAQTGVDADSMFHG